MSRSNFPPPELVAAAGRLAAIEQRGADAAAEIYGLPANPDNALGQAIAGDRKLLAEAYVAAEALAPLTAEQQCRQLPEIEVAAAWWAEALRRELPGDNGDPTAFGLAWMLRSTQPTPDEAQLERFRRLLAWAIAWQLARAPDIWNPRDLNRGAAVEPRVLAVDYGACGTLRFAKQHARIERDFPCKTTMWLAPGSVRVRDGYGSREQVLYPAEGAA